MPAGSWNRREVYEKDVDHVDRPRAGVAQDASGWPGDSGTPPGQPTDWALNQRTFFRRASPSVAILGLIALFTQVIFWIAGLLLAFIELPDFGTPLKRRLG